MDNVATVVILSVLVLLASFMGTIRVLVFAKLSNSREGPVRKSSSGYEWRIATRRVSCSTTANAARFIIKLAHSSGGAWCTTIHPYCPR